MHKTNLVLLALFVVIVLLSTSYNVYSSPLTGNVIAHYDNVREAVNDSDNLIATYNANLDKVPKFIKTIFGSERLNITLIYNDETKQSLCIITEGGKAKELKKSNCDDPTLNVWVTESSITNIVNSDDQIARLEIALNTKEIDYKAVRFITKTKMAISRIALKIFSIF